MRGISVKRFQYVRLTEAGETRVRAEGQKALLLNAVECRLGRGVRGKQTGRQAEGNRYEIRPHHTIISSPTDYAMHLDRSGEAVLSNVEREV